jgi:hypothetical protein
MILKDLPEDSRPREKLLARGPAALSDAELLALLLRTGIAGKNVLQMSQELLDTFGGVAGLLHTTATDLQRIKGLGGAAKRSQLIAVLELARRALAENLRQKTVFETPLPGQPEPADRAGGAVSGHPDANLRLPARGRHPHPGLERRQRGAGPQPPQWISPAFTR